ncbi:hypothetical protein VNO78_14647 [Psophocarpus tetragonolobus]|uniref:Uncharacterized protein n=1 Tax=Psophocarpus tetragonolobus TaxID=3891 RepID=A0AAN9SCM0_PSOTE
MMCELKCLLGLYEDNQYGHRIINILLAKGRCPLSSLLLRLVSPLFILLLPGGIFRDMRDQGRDELVPPLFFNFSFHKPFNFELRAEKRLEEKIIVLPLNNLSDLVGDDGVVMDREVSVVGGVSSTIGEDEVVGARAGATEEKGNIVAEDKVDDSVDVAFAVELVKGMGVVDVLVAG